MQSYSEQRQRMVERYRLAGYLRTTSMARAMLRVPKEKFMDPTLISYAYADQPFPIPGDGRQTISAPYMYPATYEPLEITAGNKFLEIGAGSGYGAALAYELVGEKGLVVAIEINEETYRFAKDNLERSGYGAVKLVLGDGSLGYPEEAPYDAISITAASPDFPPPLVEQLKAPGRMIAPIGGSTLFGQDLVLLEKDIYGKMLRRSLMQVVYVPLLGRHGWNRH